MEETVFVPNTSFLRCSFLPTLPFSCPGFAIQQFTTLGTVLIVTAYATGPTAVCPSCQHISRHVHRYYTRRPQDLPISRHRVQLLLRVRRFRCQNQHCQRNTFAERMPELAVFARQTTRLSKLLDSIAVVLSGQAGSRLTEQVAMEVECRYAAAASQKARPDVTNSPRSGGG